MQRILIVGAGDFGREVFNWLTTDRRHGVEYEVVGFLDDNSQALDRYSHYPIGIVGGIRDYQPKLDERLVFGIAAPQTKLNLARMLEARGSQFFTWIDQSVRIARFTQIGRGVLICANCILCADSKIEDFVTINCASTIGHDCVVGTGSMINSHCDLTGHTRLGQGVYLGSSVCLVPKVVIGDFASVGAGSTVVRKVRAGTTVMGPVAQRLPVLDETEAAA